MTEKEELIKKLVDVFLMVNFLPTMILPHLMIY